MFTDAQLELAFAYHMVQRLIGADNAVHVAEMRYLEEHFPIAALRQAGFLTDAGTYTETWRDALAVSLTELATRLSETRKQALMRTLFEASLADESFDRAEGHVLLRAASLLGLQGEALDRALRHEDVGDIELPEPESD